MAKPLGVRRLNQSYRTSAEPVLLSHEHSAWVNMPGGRLG